MKLEKKKVWWERRIRSKANGELKNNFVTVFKSGLRKRTEKLAEKHKRFSVSTVQLNTHTHAPQRREFLFLFLLFPVSVTLSRFSVFICFGIKMWFFTRQEQREKSVRGKKWNTSRGELNLEIAKLYSDLFWIYHDFEATEENYLMNFPLCGVIFG